MTSCNCARCMKAFPYQEETVESHEPSIEAQATDLIHRLLRQERYRVTRRQQKLSEEMTRLENEQKVITSAAESKGLEIGYPQFE